MGNEQPLSGSISRSNSRLDVSFSPRTPQRIGWQKDEDAPNCLNCKVEFSVFLRRHHCRVCGFIFCHECSSRLVDLPEMGYTTRQRACNGCYISIVKSSSLSRFASEHPSSTTTFSTSYKDIPKTRPRSLPSEIPRRNTYTYSKFNKSNGDLTIHSSSYNPSPISSQSASHTPGRILHPPICLTKRVATGIRCPKVVRPADGHEAHFTLECPSRGSPFKFSSPVPPSPSSSSMTPEVISTNTSRLNSEDNIPNTPTSKLTRAMNSEEELDYIYQQYLDKEHSLRTLKYMMDTFVQYNIPLPKPLAKLHRELVAQRIQA